MCTMSDVQSQGAAAAPQVRLGDVCRLAGDAQVSMTAGDRLLRKGPYPLYAENCATSGIDDYAIEAGGTVMVSAFGQVVDNFGHLIAYYEPGRCSATEHVHAFVPHDPADGRYLWRVLTTTPKAARLVTGTSQLRQVAGTSLLALSIPWPRRSVRDAYVDALDEMDRRARELADAVPQLLAEGDEAFARMVAPSGEKPSPPARWRPGARAPTSPPPTAGPTSPCASRARRAASAAATRR